MSNKLLEFHVPFSHVGKIDKDNGIIHGVSLITGGIKAKGHDLEVDDTTIQQLFDCAQKMKQVPVKWNHRTGADAVNGYVTNFWIDPNENKLRGDWHLLKSHAQFEQAIELAERMPGNIGLSAAFLPPEVPLRKDAGKARCEELVSVDLVAQPAANPGGLLSDPRLDPRLGVDSPSNVNMNGTNNPAPGAAAAAAAAAQTAEPTLADLFKLVQQQGQQLQQLAQKVTDLGQPPANEPDLAELADMTDEQLIEAGYNPAEVDAAIKSALESGELVIDGNEDPNGNGNGKNANAGGNGAGANGNANANGNTAAAAGAAPAVAAELADLRKGLQYFQTKERREILMARKEEEDRFVQAFEVLEKKVIALSAKNEALERTLKAGGGKAASPGSEIQLDAQGNEVTFPQLVNQEFGRLIKLGKPDVEARAKAVEFCVKHHTAAYRKYRSTGSQVLEFSVPQ